MGGISHAPSVIIKSTQFRQQPQVVKVEEEARRRYLKEASEKKEFLMKLEDLENKGVQLSRGYNMSDTIEDIKYEYDKQIKKRNTK